jgi:putative flippase GtrA
MASESAVTFNDGFPVRECSEAGQGSGSGLPVNRSLVISFGRLSAARIFRFAVVGGTGVMINMSVLYVLSRWAGLPLLAASALAVELAAISNYLLNDTWTFAARSPSLRRFAKFNAVSLAGLAINVLGVWLLTRLGFYFLVADLIGIAAGFAVNYAFSVRWVWGQRK